MPPAGSPLVSGAPAVIFRRPIRRHRAVRSTSRRHFSTLDPGRAHIDENVRWRQSQRFLEGRAFGMSQVDEIYDLRVLHLRRCEFRDLHRSRVGASPAQAAQRSSSGACTTRLLWSLDGVLLGGVGDSDHGLSSGPFESAASMSLRPCRRLERPVLSDMWILAGCGAGPALTRDLSCHPRIKRGIHWPGAAHFSRDLRERRRVMRPGNRA